jgi:dCMP deaminase
MKIAKTVATRSTCTRAMVGAVLVSQNRIVSTGYNGSPPGATHCIEDGCLIHKGHCIRTIHAEVNAIINLEHHYDDLILYCTHQPCCECYKLLTALGVKEIYYAHPYPDPKRNIFWEDTRRVPKMEKVGG